VNPLLTQAANAVLAKVDPRLRPAVQKVRTAGQQVLYGQSTRQMVFKQLQDLSPKAIGAGIAKLYALLFNQSKKTIPPQVGIPAATLLLFDVLQFVQDAGKINVTPPILAACAQELGSALLQIMGVTPEQLHSITAQQGQPPAAPEPGAAPAVPSGLVGGAMQGGA
jgi:hypothetical protein